MSPCTVIHLNEESGNWETRGHRGTHAGACRCAIANNNIYLFYSTKDHHVLNLSYIPGLRTAAVKQQELHEDSAFTLNYEILQCTQWAEHEHHCCSFEPYYTMMTLNNGVWKIRRYTATQNPTPVILPATHEVKQCTWSKTFPHCARYEAIV